MRRTALTVIGAGCVALSGQIALAADMPARPAYKAPPMVAAAPSWNGCYIGGHAGWAWSDWRDNTLPGRTAPFDNGAIFDEGDTVVHGFSGNFDDSGFAGGAQFGCDRQYGNWVVGVVGDFSWASLKAESAPFDIAPDVPTPTAIAKRRA